MRQFPALPALGLLCVLLLVLLTGCEHHHKRTAAQTFYLAPNGSDANDGSQRKPWLTFSHAYRAAQPGETVEIAGGTYGPQTIPVDSSKDGASNKVLIRPAPGASVSIKGLLIEGASVEIDDIATGSAVLNGRRDANDIVLRRDDIRGLLDVVGSHRWLVQGGSVHALIPVSTDPQIASYGPAINTDGTIDGVHFYDWQDVGPGAYHHIECLQVGSGVNLTIENNRFGPNCATHDLFMRSWGNSVNGGPSPLANVTVRGNDFGPCSQGCYEFYPADDLYTLGPTSLDVSFNTFRRGASPIAIAWWGSIKWHNNVQPKTSAFGCGYRTPAKPPRTTASRPPSSFMNANTFYGSGGVGCGAHASVVPAFPGPAMLPAPKSPSRTATHSHAHKND